MAVNSELALVLTAKDRAGTPLRKLKRQLIDLDKTATSMGRSFKTLGSLVGVGAGGLGAAAVTAGFAFNSFQEQSELAFKTILKDGAAAKKMVADIQTVAKATPFDTEGLTRATQRLLAFGFKAEEVLPTLTDIADTVSGLGGGVEMIDRVTTAFGQMTAKGKAQAEELMQLAEAGIPVWKILADNVGEISPRLAEAAKSGKITQTQLVDQIQKLVSGGKLKAPQAIAMLRKGMQQQFGGLSKLQAQTVGGATSTFRDTLLQLLGDLTKGPFGETAGFLLKMADALDAMREHFKNLPDPIKTVVSWAATLAAGLATLAGATGIAGLLGVLGEGGLLGILGRLASFVRGASGPGLVLAAAWEVAKIGWDRNVKPIFDTLEGYMRTFPHVKLGLSWLNDQARAVAEWVLGLGNKSASTLVRIGVQWANDAARDLAAWANAAARSVTQTVSVAVQWANDQARTLAEWANAAAKSVTQTVSVAVQWAGDTAAAIGAWLQGAGQAIGRNVELFVHWAGDVAGSLGAWFEGKGEAIGRNVQTFLYWAGDVATTLGDWFLGKGEAIGRNVEAFVHWAGDVATTLGDWFLGRGEAIGRNLQAYVSWAGDLAGRLGEWFEGRGSALGRNIQAYLSWAGDLASKIGGWLANGSNLQRTLSLGIQWASDAARRFFEWLTGGSGGAVPGGRVVNVGAGGHVPVMAAGGIVTSPTLAMIGEAGPEAVVPLSGRGGFGGNTYNVTIHTPAVVGVNALEDVVVAAIDRATRRGRIG